MLRALLYFFKKTLFHIRLIIIRRVIIITDIYLSTYYYLLQNHAHTCTQNMCMLTYCSVSSFHHSCHHLITYLFSSFMVKNQQRNLLKPTKVLAMHSFVVKCLHRTVPLMKGSPCDPNICSIM